MECLNDMNYSYYLVHGVSKKTFNWIHFPFLKLRTEETLQKPFNSCVAFLNVSNCSWTDWRSITFYGIIVYVMKYIHWKKSRLTWSIVFWLQLKNLKTTILCCNSSFISIHLLLKSNVYRFIVSLEKAFFLAQSTNLSKKQKSCEWVTIWHPGI